MSVNPRDIWSALEEAKKGKRRVELDPYVPSEHLQQNEYCLFLKPELTELTTTFDDVVAMVFERLAAFGQGIVAGAALDASYLARHAIMEQHYGVINLISRDGVGALSESAAGRLRELLGDEIESLPALGGHEFLARHSYFTAPSLSVLFDSLKSTKLGPGAYFVRAIVRGQPTIILNGFHPEQLERYTSPGASIVAFAVRSDTPWKTLRNELTGATHPQNAAPGSIRGTLHSRQRDFALKEVSAGSNGIHVSAGPVEGMVEISRYMSDFDAGDVKPLDGTTFGRLLLRDGFRQEQLHYFASNPVVQVGSATMPVFDLSEELDAKEAAERLQQAVQPVSRS